MELYNKITDILYDLELNPNTKGFKHLREAIIMYYENSRINMTGENGLYSTIAKQYSEEDRKTYHINDGTVARAIHYSISQCHDTEKLKKYTGYCGDNKISNSRFIAGLCEHLERERKCAQK